MLPCIHEPGAYSNFSGPRAEHCWTPCSPNSARDWDDFTRCQKQYPVAFVVRNPSLTSVFALRHHWEFASGWRKTKKISSKKQSFMLSRAMFLEVLNEQTLALGNRNKRLLCGDAVESFGWAVPGPALLRISRMPSPFSNQMSTVSARLIASARCIKQRRLSGAHASNHIALGERASLILWEGAHWPDVMPPSISEWQQWMCSWISMWNECVLTEMTYL